MEMISSFGWFLLFFMLIVALIAFIFYGVGSFFVRPPKVNYYQHDSNRIEEKLDRIIELLEKNNND
ncbi:DUF4083 family protein [Radiobacillus deserti]|uniref:DUF4083 domain-containing protein n=1 Tax=Radiobacillus deserti TaxID=2594883 RepID=A0A516KIA0_9BACI|nr:DUF4083 family protein [Radiobacillus deserti]QDP41127.1 DUF4083 domain-containing protein [Radiobacillus deserti]